ncbi:MAG: hypothetical protein IPO75_03715 [Betaproteobacteria bacterium]|nr:hypothetical protein [Betaproteobacteria bacterium]
MHPYYVLSDQLHRLRAGLVSDRFVKSVAAAAGRVADFLGSAEETVFILLRVGFPKIDNPVRSRRLPAEGTLSVSIAQ